MSSNWAKILFRSKRVKFGKKVTFKGVPFIHAVKGASISIGRNVTIKSSFLSNLLGIYCRSIIMARRPGATVTIGDNVGLSGVTIYARTSVSIGDNTLVGVNTKIMDNDFHPLDKEERRQQILQNQSDNEFIKSKPVAIGKDCFIGCNAIILKGTVLGDGCVVGAGSVVSGVFEPNSVIAGNPGRVIKKL